MKKNQWDQDTSILTCTIYPHIQLAEARRFTLHHPMVMDMVGHMRKRAGQSQAGMSLVGGWTQHWARLDFKNTNVKMAGNLVANTDTVTHQVKEWNNLQEREKKRRSALVWQLMHWCSVNHPIRHEPSVISEAFYSTDKQQVLLITLTNV